MDRRSFTRLSALSLAATQLHARLGAQTSAPSQKMGFAVIGLGVIAKDFMEEVASSQTVEVVAFVTGHPEKAKEWAKRYNRPDAKIYTYDQMDQMRDNPAITAVYVATPNAIHPANTIAAAKAGKHVLCEKPMASTSAEARTMIDACRAANVKLMIAYRMQYEPLHLKAREMISSGALGRVVEAQGSFGFNSRPNVWRLNKKLAGGGPLLDVGVYPLNAIRFLLGEDPAAYTAVATTQDTTSGRFKEVEETVAWTMKFPSGALAACTTSYGSNLPGTLQIHGEKGMLSFESPYGNGGIHLVGTGDAKIDLSSPKQATQLRLEAEALAENIRTNTEPRANGEVGLKDHLSMEAIYKAAGIS